MRLNVDRIQGGFLNIMLSYRGAERQPPNMLQLSLRFSLAMEERATQGLHPKDWTPETRLRKIIEEFHGTKGLLAKWHVDEDRFQSCLNLICGTTADSRAVIRGHLHANKWALSAFNAELLRRPRWLLGATPKQSGDLKQILTVDAQSQKLFLELVTHQFALKTRKLRQNQKGRARLSNAEWDSYVNFSCVFSAVLRAAAQLNNPPDMEILKAAFLSLCLGCLHLCEFNHSTSSDC